MIPLEVIETVTVGHRFKGFHGCVAARSLFILMLWWNTRGAKRLLVNVAIEEKLTSRIVKARCVWVTAERIGNTGARHIWLFHVAHFWGMMCFNSVSIFRVCQPLLDLSAAAMHPRRDFCWKLWLIYAVWQEVLLQNTLPIFAVCVCIKTINERP